MSIGSKTLLAKHTATNTLLAFLFAVLCIALIFGVFSKSAQIVIYVAFIGLLHGLLALPIFMFLNNIHRVSLLTCSLAGFFVGSLPMAIFTLPFRGKGSSAMVNDVPTVIDGVPTLAGWWHYVIGFSYLGLLGLVAGVIFWLTLNYYSKKEFNKISSLFRTPLTWAITGLLIAVLIIPIVIKDRSCHNSLRGGASSISPVLNFFVDVPMSEWGEVKSLFSSFAIEQDLSLRDSSQSIPGTLESLYLSLCRESGVNISIIEQRWASQDYKHPIPSILGVSIRVYSPNELDEWQSLAAAFIEAVERQWPSRITYKGPRGQTIERSETNLDVE